MTSINHNISTPALSACLLPLGLHLNAKLLELKTGDEVEFRDGNIGIVRSVQKVSAESSLTDAISYMIYGISLDKFWEALQRNYAGRLYRDNGLILLTYKIKEE